MCGAQVVTATDADAFLVTPETIASWAKRLDEQGANALPQNMRSDES